MAVETLLPAAVLDEIRWSARLQLGIERRAQGSVLATRRHEGPLRVQKTLYPEGPDPTRPYTVAARCKRPTWFTMPTRRRSALIRKPIR
jgi:hypothetical protein